jgi:hypothetical protein
MLKLGCGRDEVSEAQAAFHRKPVDLCRPVMASESAA